MLKLLAKASTKRCVGSCPALVSGHVAMKLTGEKTGPKSVLCHLGNVVSPSIRPRGRSTVRKAVGCRGMGSRRKQTASCNRWHTCWNITRHESAPTSAWSWFATTN